MANGYLGFQNPGTENKKIDTEELTVGGQTVQRERIQVSGDADVAIAEVKNTVPGASDYGLVTREAGVQVINPASGDQTPSGALSVASLLYGYEGANWDQIRSLWSESDALGGVVVMATGAFNYLYNETPYGGMDKERANTFGTALSSAARTTTTYSDKITNHNAKGIIALLNVSGIVATPSITMAIQAKDELSGEWYDLTGETGALTNVGNKFLTVYPGAVDTDTKGKSVGLPLPRSFRIRITHADADSITYSVGYHLIR